MAGDKAVNLGTLTTKVSSFDASAMTAGGVTVNFGASAGNTSIKGSAGNDTVTATAAVNYTIDLGAGDDLLTTADAAGELTVNDSLAGGEGTDTLAIASAAAAELDDNTDADKAVLAKISGFEQLRITNDLADDINIGRLGYNYLQLADDVTNGGAGDVTVSGFTSGATVEFRDAASATDALVVTMTGATAAGTDSDTINLKLNAELTANNTSYTYGVDLAGINIVNISSNDRDTTTVADTDNNGNEGYVINLAAGTAANSANIKTVNITGAAQTSYTVNAATTALATVNAADATGNVLLNAAAFNGTEGLTITTGAGKDVIFGTKFADKINGGAGDDVIWGDNATNNVTAAGPETSTIALAATYDVGDKVSVTINGVKNTHTVIGGGTALAAVAAALETLIDADTATAKATSTATATGLTINGTDNALALNITTGVDNSADEYTTAAVQTINAAGNITLAANDYFVLTVNGNTWTATADATTPTVDLEGWTWTKGDVASTQAAFETEVGGTVTLTFDGFANDVLTITAPKTAAGLTNLVTASSLNNGGVTVATVQSYSAAAGAPTDQAAPVVTIGTAATAGGTDVIGTVVSDTLTGGAGKDTFKFINGTTATTLDTITDLDLGTASAADKVDVLSFEDNFAGTIAKVTLSEAQQTTVTGKATLALAYTAVTDILAGGEVAQFTYGSDTYIAFDGQTNDYIVKVTGVAGTLDAGDISVFGAI